ncbi:MAG: WXG100 family type VII secretion target, partial [Actinomycetota bacterium]
MTTLSWDALGGDPAPGDPGAFDALARSFSETAENAGEAHARLARFGSSVDAGIWSGEAADGFREKIGELPPRLKKLHDSYETAASGMGEYARTLRDLQAKARALLGRAEVAQDEKISQERSRDQAQAADPMISASAYDSAIADAGRRLGLAEREIAELRERRVAAERRALGRLEDAEALGIRNDPWYKRAFDAIDRFIDQHADILRAISNVLK